MAFSGASIKYKPLKVGFLVREGNIEDLKKVAGINTVLWGGKYNPIIPIAVSGDNEFAKQLVDLFSVDLLCDVANSNETKAFKKLYPFLRDPGHYSEDIFYEDGHGRSEKKLVSGLLDSKNIVDLFWSKKHSSKPADYKSNFLLTKWNEADPLANVFALQFGFFPKQNFKWDYENAFLKGLHAKELEIAQADNLVVDHKKNISPIDTTGAELRIYAMGSRLNQAGIYIGDSNNFHDLLTFWNIRASDISVVFFAKDSIDRTKPFVQGFLDFLNTLPNHNPNFPDFLTAYYASSDKEIVKAVSPHLSSKKSLSWHHVSEHSWNGMNIQPSYQVFKWQHGTVHIEKEHERYVANVQLPNKNFLVDDDNIDISFQQLGVIIDPYSSSEYNHPGYTFKLPNIRELNEFYSREIIFDPWSLRIEKDGFSKVIKANEESVSLSPVSKQLLVEKLFETVKIKAQTSQAGLIARKIIEKIGGLEDARVLKIKGVRKILGEGKPETSITRGEATKIIYENDFDKHKKLFIESREKSELNGNAVFDYLLKKEYFRAGLELKCQDCKLDNWLSLKNIDDQWACEYCGGHNQTSIHLRHRGDWKFRKSGLFSKDNHQEGSIPVLLTLLTLKRIWHSEFIHTTALELEGEDIKCETDLFVLQESRRDGLEMGIGECKSEGGTITKDDCEKLKKVASKLKILRKDSEVYIIFSKTADNFTAEEIALFKELSKDFRLVLFTNKELELYHPYWLPEGGIETDIPEKYPLDLSDLARNSKARYLKE